MSCASIRETSRRSSRLLLALTDRFGKGYAIGDTQTKEVLQQIRDPYERAYYPGIVSERRAKAKLHQGGPGAGFTPTSFSRSDGLLRKSGSHAPAWK